MSPHTDSANDTAVVPGLRDKIEISSKAPVAKSL